MAHLSTPDAGAQPNMLRPKDRSSRKISFHNLPLELQQTIIDYAATDSPGARELYVTYTLYDITHDKTGRLQSQALAILDKLRRVGKKIFETAINYLTGPLFRWVFVSETQPHMFLIRALRKWVNKNILARITRIRLQHFTVTGQICPPPFKVGDVYISRYEVISWMKIYSAYFQRLSRADTYDEHNFSGKVKRDVGYSLTLLPPTLPALQQLELELDVVDCLRLVDRTKELLCVTQLPSNFWQKGGDAGIFLQLGAIGNGKSVGSIDLHVFWKDLGIRSRLPCYKLKDEDAKTIQDLYLEDMRKVLSFKSVTGHS